MVIDALVKERASRKTVDTVQLDTDPVEDFRELARLKGQTSDLDAFRNGLEGFIGNYRYLFDALSMDFVELQAVLDRMAKGENPLDVILSCVQVEQAKEERESTAEA